MKNRLIALGALLTVALTTGCGLIDQAAPGTAGTGPAATPAETGAGSRKEAGDLPNPCTLLSEAEVADLTGREVTQVDEDDADTGDLARFCQWQQDGGQLAIFLTRTTEADFQVTVTDAEPVDGVGQNAYRHSGHLFVLHGTVQIDVYARGGSDDGNLDDAKDIAGVLIPRL